MVTGNDFSYDEKKAIICVLAGIMSADNSVADEEALYLSGICIALGITPNEAKDAINMSPEKSISIIRAMSNQKKTEFSYMMGKMAMADGYFHEKEKEIMVLIKLMCQL